MLKTFKQVVYFYVLSFILAILVLSCNKVAKLPTIESNINGLSSQLEKLDAGSYPFFIISDWGFNGHFSQKEVAMAMEQTCGTISPKMIVSCGDNFQVNGVQSVNDPLWMTNFEQVYSHPGLLVDWHPVLGNHDYKGNTQALIDYSLISRRWKMPAHYYTLVKTVNDSTQARFVFIDTPSLLSYYWQRANDYPDVVKQDSAQQIVWLRDVLANADEDWIFVFGHHPLFSFGSRHGDTPELIAKLKGLFDEHHVDFYFSGHDHDFQHINPDSGKVDYFVTGTGGRIRENNSEGKAIFSASTPGFTLADIDHNKANIHFISSRGRILYSFLKQKQ
jgi:tartrate-resistant acid phosphatase type 5